jgi:hypothetical protein
LRIATFLDEYCDGDSAPFGHYIERETGIEALSHSGFGSYVVWKTVACDLPIAELLDVITAIARFAPTRSIRNDRMTVTTIFSISSAKLSANNGLHTGLMRGAAYIRMLINYLHLKWAT